MRTVFSWMARHPFASVLGAAVLGLATFAIWNLARPDHDPRLDQIRKAGYPVTLSELDAWYSAVPAQENAAVAYAKAAQLPLVHDSALLYDILPDKQTNAWRRGHAFEGETRMALEALFSTNQAAMALLHSATNFKGCRFPVDLKHGEMVLLPHLAPQKQIMNLLGTEALLYASKGEAGRCARSFEAAASAADSIREEPLLISHLVRIASWAIFAKRLELALNLVELSDKDAAVLQERVAAAEDRRGLCRALAGERTMGLAFFTDPRGQSSLWQQGAGMFPSGFAARGAFSLLKMSGFLRKDKEFYLDAMATNLALAEAPLEQRSRLSPQRTPPLPPSRFMIISRMLLPALSRFAERDSEHCARMRVVRSALAVERFRQAHAGALPETLEALTPPLLPAVPLDLDGNPIRYRKLQKGYMVYSVGADGADDGGTEPVPNSKQRVRDITFIVER